MVAPQSFSRPSVSLSRKRIHLHLKAHAPVPSHLTPYHNLSPAPYRHSSTPLRKFAHLATVSLTTCVEAAAFVSAHVYQVHMLLLTVYFTVFNSFIPVWFRHASAYVSHAIPPV
eukprot:4099002-Pleurochrysis_carterae.AAC.1